MALLFLPPLALPVMAQSSMPSPPPRTVQVDVTVTNAQGRPVASLPRSAFHLSDSGQPQAIRSFTEHSTHPLAKTARNGSNPSHAVYNVALLDVASMPVLHQMALREQLLRALRQAPLTEPVALYLHCGPRIVLLQNFTTHRKALLAAVRSALPTPHPQPAQPDLDIRLFSQMVHSLSHYPGRKNLLWFHGEAGLVLMSTHRAVPTQPGFPPQVSLGFSPLYNSMAAERIALYPIGVRWLAPSAANVTSTGPQPRLLHAEAVITGGHAYQAVLPATRAILTGSPHFYTLTYSSTALLQPSHWHSIRITVHGPYHLRYRHGYFDNNYQPTLNPTPPPARQTAGFPAPPTHRVALVFQARIRPAGASPQSSRTQPAATRLYTIHYRLPASAFQRALLNPHPSHPTLGLAILVLDKRGYILAHQQKMLSVEPLHASIHGSFAVTQTIAAPSGRKRFYLAVWNSNTGRLGTLLIPVKV